MVVFATQSVEDATNSAISETLIQQTATQSQIAASVTSSRGVGPANAGTR